MKRLIALLVGLSFVVPGYAQLKEKGFFVEMDGAYGHYEKYSYSQSFMVIGPSLGYKINPRWSVGTKMLFETAGFNYATFGIYRSIIIGTARDSELLLISKHRVDGVVQA